MKHFLPLLLVISCTSLHAADGDLAGELEKLDKAYRAQLETLQKRAADAGDTTTGQSITKLLATPPIVAAAGGQAAAAPFAIGSEWQGKMVLKHGNKEDDNGATGRILASTADAFTIEIRFAKAVWVYECHKPKNRWEVSSATAKAGIRNLGLAVLESSTVDIVTEKGKETINLRVVRKNDNVTYDAKFELKLKK